MIESTLVTKRMLRYVKSKYFLNHNSNRNPTGNLTGYCIPYFTEEGSVLERVE
jgi:hypothetical protein